MSTTQRVGVAVLGLGLLGLGAFLVFGSSEAPLPPSPVARAPDAIVPPPPTPPQPATAPNVAPAPQGAAPVAVPTTPGAAPTTTPVEYAPSPFETSDSAELQYAAKLVIGENTGPAEWRKAVEVFQRCLDQNPLNHLCKRGVYAAWERIDSDGGRPTTNLTVETLGPAGLELKRDARIRPDGLQAPALRLREE